MLIVAGLGGEPDYAEAFIAQADAAATEAKAVGAAVSLLVGDGARREDIRAAIAEIAAAAGVDDAVIVQLIGHGSWDDEHYRFNVPGPDPTADDLAAWLAALTAKRQLVVIATSASGAAIEPLQRDARAIITATRDGRERNAVAFGGFWADALVDPSADADKDQRVSAEEAFRFAERAVADHYRSHQRIATEHPRREGSATSFLLAVVAEESIGDQWRQFDPALDPLAKRQGELLREIEQLKVRKSGMAEDDYFARLQSLLLELAPIERQLRDSRESKDQQQLAPLAEEATRP